MSNYRGVFYTPSSSKLDMSTLFVNKVYFYWECLKICPEHARKFLSISEMKHIEGWCKKLIIILLTQKYNTSLIEV